jgi:hypothetical protein
MLPLLRNLTHYAVSLSELTAVSWSMPIHLAGNDGNAEDVSDVCESPLGGIQITNRQDPKPGALSEAALHVHQEAEDLPHTGSVISAFPVTPVSLGDVIAPRTGPSAAGTPSNRRNIPCGVSAVNAILGQGTITDSDLRAKLSVVGESSEQYNQSGASVQLLLKVLAKYQIGVQSDRMHRGYPGFTAALELRLDHWLLLNNGSHWTALCRCNDCWELRDGDRVIGLSDCEAAEYVRKFARHVDHWILPLGKLGTHQPEYNGPAIVGLGRPIGFLIRGARDSDLAKLDFVTRHRDVLQPCVRTSKVLLTSEDTDAELCVACVLRVASASDLADPALGSLTKLSRLKGPVALVLVARLGSSMPAGAYRALMHSVIGQVVRDEEAEHVAIVTTTTGSGLLGSPVTYSLGGTNRASESSERDSSIRELVCEVLANAAPSIRLTSYPPSTPFGKLGFGSKEMVLAAQLLIQELNLPLSPVSLYDYASLDQLVAHIIQLKRTSQPPAMLDRCTGVLCNDQASRLAQVCVASASYALPGDLGSRQKLCSELATAGNAICTVPAQRWSLDEWYSPEPAAGKTYTQHGGFLGVGVVEAFDAELFKITFTEARVMSPAQRLLLRHAKQALGELRSGDYAVYVGSSHHDWERLHHTQVDSPYSTTGTATSVLAGRISYQFGLTGQCTVVDTACSSSMVAASLARSCIVAGECSGAVVAGENLLLDPTTTVQYSQTRMLARGGACKTFDAMADGYVSPCVVQSGG